MIQYTKEFLYPGSASQVSLEVSGSELQPWNHILTLGNVEFPQLRPLLGRADFKQSCSRCLVFFPLNLW